MAYKKTALTKQFLLAGKVTGLILVVTMAGLVWNSTFINEFNAEIKEKVLYDADAVYETVTTVMKEGGCATSGNSLSPSYDCETHKGIPGWGKLYEPGNTNGDGDEEITPVYRGGISPRGVNLRDYSQEFIYLSNNRYIRHPTMRDPISYFTPVYRKVVPNVRYDYGDSLYIGSADGRSMHFDDGFMLFFIPDTVDITTVNALESTEVYKTSIQTLDLSRFKMGHGGTRPVYNAIPMPEGRECEEKRDNCQVSTYTPGANTPYMYSRSSINPQQRWTVGYCSHLRYDDGGPEWKAYSNSAGVNPHRVINLAKWSCNNPLVDDGGGYVWFQGEQLKPGKYTVVFEVINYLCCEVFSKTDVVLRFKTTRPPMEILVETECTADFNTVRFMITVKSPGVRITKSHTVFTPNIDGYTGASTGGEVKQDTRTGLGENPSYPVDINLANLNEAKKLFQYGIRVHALVEDDMGNTNDGAGTGIVPLVYTTPDSHFNACGVAYFQTMGGDFRTNEAGAGGRQYNRVWLGARGDARVYDNMTFPATKKYLPDNRNTSDFTFEYGGSVKSCPSAHSVTNTRQSDDNFCFPVQPGGITQQLLTEPITDSVKKVNQVVETAHTGEYRLSSLFSDNPDFTMSSPALLKVKSQEITINDDIPGDQHAKVFVQCMPDVCNLKVKAVSTTSALATAPGRSTYDIREKKQPGFRMYITDGVQGTIELVPLDTAKVNIYQGAMFARSGFITSVAERTDVVRGFVVADRIIASGAKVAGTRNSDLYFKDFTHPVLLIDFDPQYMVYRGFGGLEGDVVEREHLGL